MKMQKNLIFLENVNWPHEFDKLFIIPPPPRGYPQNTRITAGHKYWRLVYLLGHSPGADA